MQASHVAWAPNIQARSPRNSLLQFKRSYTKILIIMSQSVTPSKIIPRIRILRGKAIALGPGKADLLTLIAETGSINSAAKRMKMSYMRAWLLVKVMNDCFREPLVRTVRGGAEKGGAKLTECGERVLQLYREMERQESRSDKSHWKTV